MPDVMMQLGNFQFSINTAAYQALHRTAEYRWAEMQRISHRPSLQFVGIGIDEIELRGVILPTFKGGIHQVDILRVYAQKTGATKLNIVQAAMQSLYATEQSVASVVPVDKLTTYVTSIASTLVDTFNKLGWFKKTTPVAA